MSAERDAARAPGQGRGNVRLGLILGSVALTVFFGVILRYWILR